jgi:hypothetical protein
MKNLSIGCVGMALLLQRATAFTSASFAATSSSQSSISPLLFSTPSSSSDATAASISTDNNKEETYYVKCGNCQSVYPFPIESLGPSAKGRRLECTLCQHSWFQSKERLLVVKPGFDMVALPESDLKRIQTNIAQGRHPKFMGEIKLYVGNIAFQCSEENLQELFETVGEVGEVSLVRDETGRPRGFGFVTLRYKADGLKALQELNNKEVMGRAISVRESTN